MKDLLAPSNPANANLIDASRKDPQGRWYAEMLLPEVIIYNHDLLKAGPGAEGLGRSHHSRLQRQDRHSRRHGLRHDAHDLQRDDLPAIRSDRIT